MPWPVYSERFLHHGAEGVWRYTVPPETRLVVTEVVAVSLVGPPANIALALGPLYLAYHDFLEIHEVFSLSTRQVGYQGEVLALEITESGIHCTISGYLLADHSGRTGPPIAPGQLPSLPDMPPHVPTS